MSENLRLLPDTSAYGLDRYATSVCTVLAGEGVGLVSEIEGAEEIVLRVEAEAVSAVQGMQAILQIPSVAEVGSM